MRAADEAADTGAPDVHADGHAGAKTMRMLRGVRIPRNMACIWSIVSDCSEVQLNGNC